MGSTVTFLCADGNLEDSSYEEDSDSNDPAAAGDRNRHQFDMRIEHEQRQRRVRQSDGISAAPANEVSLLTYEGFIYDIISQA